MGKFLDYFRDIPKDSKGIIMIKAGEFIAAALGISSIAETIIKRENRLVETGLSLAVLYGLMGARKLLEQKDQVHTLRTSTNVSYYFPGLDTNVALGEKSPRIHYLGYVKDLEANIAGLAQQPLVNFRDEAGGIFHLRSDGEITDLYLMYRPSLDDTTDLFTRGFYEGKALSFLGEGSIIRGLVKGHIKPDFRFNNGGDDYIGYVAGVYACIRRGKDPRNIQNGKFNREVIRIIADDLLGKGTGIGKFKN